MAVARRACERDECAGGPHKPPVPLPYEFPWPADLELASKRCVHGLSLDRHHRSLEAVLPKTALLLRAFVQSADVVVNDCRGRSTLRLLERADRVFFATRSYAGPSFARSSSCPALGAGSVGPQNLRLLPSAREPRLVKSPVASRSELVPSQRPPSKHVQCRPGRHRIRPARRQVERHEGRSQSPLRPSARCLLLLFRVVRSRRLAPRHLVRWGGNHTLPRCVLLPCRKHRLDWSNLSLSSQLSANHVLESAILLFSLKFESD